MTTIGLIAAGAMMGLALLAAAAARPARAAARARR